MATKPTKISRVKAGDPLSSKHYNQLVDSINLIMDAISGVEGLSTTLRLIELDEDMTQFGRDKTGNRILYDLDVSAGSDPITDFGIDETYVSEVQNGIHLVGERLPLMFDRSSGKQLILPVLNWHIAKLTSSLSPGGTATATIWQVGASDEEASAITGVTVYDWALGDGAEAIASGTRVIVILHRQSRRWYVVGQISSGMKELGRATFDAAFSTVDEKVQGTLTNQYGVGASHTASSITLYNLETDTDDVYEFFGREDDACICGYRGTGADWQIIIPQCPPEAS